MQHGHQKKESKLAQCGTWQHNYTTFHHTQMSYKALGGKPPRMLIFKSPNSGVTDRLMGLITGFYAAVLSQRVFLVTDWWTYRDVQVDLSHALAWAHINLTLPGDMEAHIRPPRSEYVHLNYINSEPLFSPKADAQQKIDITTLFSTAANDSTILYESNRGNTLALLQARGAVLGIHPPYGLYCAFHFLFSPKPEVVDIMRPLYAALSDEHVVKLGLQIRSGDHGYSFPTTTTIGSQPYFGNFFSCAQTVETSLKQQLPPEQRPHKLFLISDSKSLKIDAALMYPGLLTDTANTPMHVGISNDVNNLAANGSYAMHVAIADVLLLAQCDFFIVSHDSGMGKLAALIRCAAVLSTRPAPFFTPTSTHLTFCLKSHPTPPGLTTATHPLLCAARMRTRAGST